MSLTNKNTADLARPPRRQLANAIRALSMDAVEKARSGHPGMPLGMADIAEVLWNDFLAHNPANPRWFDRDRFVLSNGHGSMLLYSLAHLSGYPLRIEELENFRQFSQRTAGHPERDLDIGVETTTGPLGQGLANAVGMALAEKVLAATYNRPGADIVDHHTYVVLGDGCMMEGVSHEACSLAGTFQLGKLIALYDDNGISIDGDTEGWFTDDTPARFRAYGWHVIDTVDGHDADAIAAAIAAAKAETSRPTLICCQTIIGWGAPNKQGSESTHGAPLGPDEIAATRANIGWEHAAFVIPEDIRNAWDARERGAELEAEWQERFAAYRNEHPELAADFERRMRGELPDDWNERADAVIGEIVSEAKDAATRQASQRALEGFAPQLPELIGGSADLTGSNNTFHSGSKVIDAGDAAGNYINFGVREFGMAAVMNGLALHGGFMPYGGTFLVFSDYARNALRMAALMKMQSIFVLTHDSIGLGEDGPTHQPVEHLASLRAMPNMWVWRPCDGVETAVAWRSAIERNDGPASLVLTRQGVPHMPRTAAQVDAIARGGYILADADGEPELVLIASGSEVGLVVEAAKRLNGEGRRVRVVSMPCTEAFDLQSDSYRAGVLPESGARLAVEAGTSDSWWRYVAGKGSVISIDRFGQSAPAKDLFEHYGFTPDAVTEAARSLLA
ncbi:MAG: transketolase [Gammaproteobacteria bacterium]|nr:transketolase [Gammaproteobacteria bacterium]MDH3506458.1 transketolase [Gammaproteobacteria bacterium]